MALRATNIANMNAQENIRATKGSKMVTRSTRQRAALGEIGNKQNIITKVDAVKPKPQMAKQKGTSSLLAMAKPVSKKLESPVPMEVAEREVKELTSAFSSQQLESVEDIDAADADNPQLCSIYVNDIYSYLRKLEDQTALRQDFLKNRTVNGNMRKILVDWLVQVHLRFRLLQETLYMTIDILDRHLQVQDVSKSKLQLVGVTAMFISSKYEEMYAPEIGDFVYITDNAYTSKEIMKTERLMLKSINFTLGKPLPLHFLRRFSKAGNADGTMHTLAKYLMELSMVDYDMAHYNPSLRAASALCLSMKILIDLCDFCEWSDALIHYSGFKEKDLKTVMSKMARLIVMAEKSKYQAVRSKFSSAKFMKISLMAELKSDIVTEIASLKC